MTTVQIKKNYELFKNAFRKYVGENELTNLLSYFNNEEIIANATFSTNVDTGSAYDGSLIENVFKIAKTAKEINNILPDNNKVDEDSLSKIILLQHIAKIEMFEPNDNSWEKTNRGMLYKFRDLSGALRLGERSLLIANNIGVSLSPVEYEAIRILDKSDDDNFSKIYSSTYSIIVKQANEIVNHLNRENA